MVKNHLANAGKEGGGLQSMGSQSQTWLSMHIY